MKPRLLLVDDDADIVQLLRLHLEKEGCQVRATYDAAGFHQARQEEEFETLLVDLRLPDADGLELLREARQSDPLTPVIVITAHGGVNEAVSAMRAGAYDFCPKPIDLQRLSVSVHNAIEQARLRRRLETLESSQRSRLGRLLGASPAMQVVYRIIETVGPTRAPVLITGESGTGKELAAQAIHERSPRKENELVDLNCAAIPRDLLESELFGYEKAAFTGANERFMGRFERADGSTLFLDEITEMESNLQAKMLRFLEEHAFYRLGGREKIHVDIRIIAATNRAPEQAIQSGQFREDLFHRLNVVRLAMPSLRERPEDIPLLAEMFLQRYAEEHNKPFTGIDDGALEALAAYSWPGNVRELQNAIQQAVVLNQGEAITREMLPPAVKSQASAAQTGESAPAQARPGSGGITPFDVIERQAIEHALRVTQGNVAKASTALRLSQATLYRKIREYGLNLQAIKENN